ncbi:hypothetical protein ACVMH6_000239 [Rhizobium leguminosarum]
MHCRPFTVMSVDDSEFRAYQRARGRSCLIHLSDNRVNGTAISRDSKGPER